MSAILSGDASSPEQEAVIRTASDFTVLIPFYNEAGYIESTLQSWLNQTQRPRRIILVDNASTDGSREIAVQLLTRAGGVDFIAVVEPVPGKAHALAKGLEYVDTEYVALSDADTYYPPRYLELCDVLFRESGAQVSAVMALVEFGDPCSVAARWLRRYFVVLSRIFPRHCYTGGAGQVFRSGALREAGGFSVEIWPHVLMDHEIMNRIFKKGRSRYHEDFWCLPSERRKKRTSVRWSLYERLLYQFTPHRFHDWFFYQFLGPRFTRKNMNQLRLREQTWRNP